MQQSSFAINGRFLTHNATGVQRYAMNVVRAIDAQVPANKTIRLVAPNDAHDPELERIKTSRFGPLSGHLWEQTTLPARYRGPLLNLCNTGPALKADQVVCIHDANIFSAPDSYSRSFRELYRRLQPVLVQRSTRIVTVSHAAARQLARHLPIEAKDIAILSNGHEHALAWNSALANTAPRLVESRIASRGRVFIVAIGSQARHKNLILLIEMAEALDRLGIDIVVVGGDAGIFALSDQQSRRNVHWPGRLADDDLAYLLEHALCLAFPSLAEGFGLPIVEAMARGCPVISSDCASMPEVCGDAALLASPRVARQWLDHIKTLQGSQQLRADLIGRGRDQIQKFTWRETASQYLQLMEHAPAPCRKSTVPTTPTRTSVVIATRGRPSVVEQTVKHLLDNQSQKPLELIISCVEKSDAGSLVGDHRVKVLTGPAGLAAQRNTALAALSAEAELVVFFDDDFVAHRDWIASAGQAFKDESQVVGFTGRVVADGIRGPGITFDEAATAVANARRGVGSWQEPFSPYGCNMAFRISAIGPLRFDERLVLYGWLEDRDFAAALSKGGGRLVKSDDAIGAHMGVKGGRVSGRRLGYSQVVNPLYMLSKGTMKPREVITHVACNMAINLVRAARPEAFIDRRGRAVGNLVAIMDIVRGRLQPERAAFLFVNKPVLQSGVNA